MSHESSVRNIKLIAMAMRRCFLFFYLGWLGQRPQWT